MKITQVEVTYSETQSLPGYCNVRPGLRLVAELAEGEDYPDARDALFKEAREIVQAEIDEALVAEGLAPKYFDGPRYQVMMERSTKLVVIFPNSLDWRRMSGYWEHPYLDGGDVRRLRIDQAMRLAESMAASKDYMLIDCGEGDLSALPVELIEEEVDVVEEDEVPF